MDQSRFIAKHVVNLPKPGSRDFFDFVARMKDAISLGVGEVQHRKRAVRIRLHHEVRGQTG